MLILLLKNNVNLPIPVAARFTVWVCDPWLARNVGSNPAKGMDVCLLCV
jgi:hypothetical protein